MKRKICLNHSGTENTEKPQCASRVEIEDYWVEDPNRKLSVFCLSLCLCVSVVKDFA